VENLTRIREMNLSVCALDMPDKNGLPGTQFPQTHPVGYMRFHGRNSADWWSSGAGWKRYNYLYRDNELIQLLPDIKNWMKYHQKTYLYFNNHYRAQAVDNAQMIMAFLAD
jgi:uncharacterized protein YecE (DUF72 family)